MKMLTNPTSGKRSDSFVKGKQLKYMCVEL